jgi:hypothetical protein
MISRMDSVTSCCTCLYSGVRLTLRCLRSRPRGQSTQGGISSDSGMKWPQAVFSFFRIGVPARISPFPLA